MQDVLIDNILNWYDSSDFSHAEALAITEIPDRTLQIWHQRGHLNRMEMTARGRGKRRKYTLGQLLFLGYMRRLTFLSVPVGEAAQIASGFLSSAAPAGTPRGAVVPIQIASILPALEAAADPMTSDGRIFGLIYRTVDDEWRHRIAGISELTQFGGLAQWISTCTLDGMALVTDLGQLARATIARALDARRKRRQ